MKKYIIIIHYKSHESLEHYYNVYEEALKSYELLINSPQSTITSIRLLEIVKEFKQ